MILPDHLNQKNKKIIDRYGLDHQLLQLVEECAELIQAVSKLRRAKEKRNKAQVQDAEQDLKMEMADVMVLLSQIIDRYDISEEELNRMASYKINRELGRIEQCQPC